MKINNDNIDKVIDTLTIVADIEATWKKGTDSRILEQNGLLKIAEGLAENRMLLAGDTYNGKILENRQYFSTILGTRVLEEHNKTKENIPSEKTLAEPMYHSV